MSDTDKDVAKAKIELDSATKQLEDLKKECADQFGKNLALDGLSIGLGVLGGFIAPQIGAVWVFFDVVGAIGMHKNYGEGCYQEEVNHWENEAKRTKNKYKNKLSEQEFEKSLPVMLLPEVREKKIKEWKRLSELRSKDVGLQSKIHSLHDEIYGPSYWAFDTHVSKQAIDRKYGDYREQLKVAMQKVKGGNKLAAVGVFSNKVDEHFADEHFETLESFGTNVNSGFSNEELLKIAHYVLEIGKKEHRTAEDESATAISKKLQLPKEKVYLLLVYLNSEGEINFTGRNQTPSWQYNLEKIQMLINRISPIS